MGKGAGPVVVAPIDRLGGLGVGVRAACLPLIDASTPFLLFLQSKRSRGLTRVMKAFSFLGLEEFFTGLIMLFLWVLDAKFGRLFVVLLASGFYTAGFLKSLLCLPRPSAPPVQPADVEDKDWAVPSNHSMLGLLMPWYIWNYMSRGHLEDSPALLIPVFCVLCIWTGGVNLSRLYLGVHGVLDVVAGNVLGMVLIRLFEAIDEDLYAAYRLLSPAASVAAAAGSVVLFWAHPRTWPETQSCGESVIVVACALGALGGRPFGPAAAPPLAALQAYPADPLLSNLLLRGLPRFLLGAALVLGFRALVKPLMVGLCGAASSALGLRAYSYAEECRLPGGDPLARHFHPSRYALPPTRPRPHSPSPHGSKAEAEEGPQSHWLPPSQRPWNIDLPVRFVVYSGMGFLASEIIPLLFLRLGI